VIQSFDGGGEGGGDGQDYGHEPRTRLRAETPCTKRSHPPRSLFQRQVDEGRHYGVQARARHFLGEENGYEGF
jgi:hypothetical protein